MDFQLTGSLIADLELLLSLGLLLGLFFFLALHRPVAGLMCFIFLVLTRAHEYIPGSAAFRPSVIVGAVMLAALFIHFWLNRQPLYFTRPHSLILLVFVAICWISLFTRGQTIDDPHGHLLIEPLLLVVVVFFALLNTVKNWRDYRIVLLTLAFGGLTIAVLTLVQSFVTGIMYGRSWIYESESGVFTRAGAVGLNPNAVAFALSMLLPVNFLLLNNEKRSMIRKGLYLLNVPLFVVTVLLTFSRGGFISLAAALFLIFGKKLSAKHSLVLAVLLIGIFVFLPGAFWERLFSLGTTDPTGQGRTIIWRAALNMIAANPLMGIGYGQFYYLYGDYGEFWKHVASHNTYLSIAAETGLVNLAVFLGLVSTTFLNLHRLKREALQLADAWVAQVADVLKAGLIVALVYGMAADISDQILLYIYIALAAILRRLWTQSRNLAPEQPCNPNGAMHFSSASRQSSLA